MTPARIAPPIRITCSALSSFLRNLHPLSRRGSAPRAAYAFSSRLPAAGSACKRHHLFLRWMIRTEGFDLGLWTGGRFTPARLLLPMDVHVHRISRRIGLTRRRKADLAASREATGWLRRLNPEDPVAYDWPLSRLGILGLPVRRAATASAVPCGPSAARPSSRPSGPPRHERFLDQRPLVLAAAALGGAAIAYLAKDALLPPAAASALPCRPRRDVPVRSLPARRRSAAATSRRGPARD